MSQAALSLVQEAPVVDPEHYLIESKNPWERWLWVSATSRYSWKDAVLAKPLMIAPADVVHLHGWRSFVCLELKGEPGEELWVRRTTWQASPQVPEPQCFGDMKHFSRKMLADVMLLLVSPATLAMGLFYLFMFAGAFEWLGSACADGYQETFRLYARMVSTLFFTPFLTYGYYRLLRQTRFMTYEVRRIYTMTVGALFLVGISGLAGLAADSHARETLTKIQSQCLKR